MLASPPTDEAGRWRDNGTGWEEVTQEWQAEQRLAEIDAQLGEIDAASIRPLRAMADNTATEQDAQKLKELDALALALREERALLA